MDWWRRLNRGGEGVSLGEGAEADVLHWVYSSALVDNVPHRHTFYEVCLVGKQGAGLFHVAGEVHRIAPGDVFFARPGVVHQITNDDPAKLMELFWVAFTLPPAPQNKTEEDMALLLRLFAQSERLLCRDESAARAAMLWRTLQAAASAPLSPGRRGQIENIAGATLLALLECGADCLPSETERPEEGAHTSLLRRAARYMEDNLNRSLSVAEVAAQVGLSPRHLGRLFGEWAGTSPAAYIDRARLDRAAALLKGSAKSVGQIGAIVGYSDGAHFSRAFTRRFGCTPGAYRKTGGKAGAAAQDSRHQPPGSFV
jgi:AraC family L-rhamnose operon transcriptional activator RhaR